MSATGATTVQWWGMAETSFSVTTEWFPGKEDRINLGPFLEQTPGSKSLQDLAIIPGILGDHSLDLKIERDSFCTDSYTLVFDDTKVLVSGSQCGKLQAPFTIQRNVADIRWKGLVQTLRKYDKTLETKTFAKWEKSLIFALDPEQSHKFQTLLDPVYDPLRGYWRLYAEKSPEQRAVLAPWLQEMNQSFGIPSLEILTFDAFTAFHEDPQIGSEDAIRWGNFFSLLYPQEEELEKTARDLYSNVPGTQGIVDEYHKKWLAEKENRGALGSSLEVTLGNMLSSVAVDQDPMKRIPGMLAERYPELPSAMAQRMKAAYETWVLRRLPYTEPDLKKEGSNNISVEEQILLLGLATLPTDLQRQTIEKQLKNILKNPKGRPEDLQLVQAVYVTYQFRQAVILEKAMESPLSESTTRELRQFWIKQFREELLKPVLAEMNHRSTELGFVRTRTENLLTLPQDDFGNMNNGVVFEKPKPPPPPALIPPPLAPPRPAMPPPVAAKDHSFPLPWVAIEFGIGLLGLAAGLALVPRESRQGTTQRKILDVGKQSLMTLGGAGLFMGTADTADYLIFPKDAPDRDLYRRTGAGILGGAAGYIFGVQFPIAVPPPPPVITNPGGPPGNNNNTDDSADDNDGDDNTTEESADAKHPTGEVGY